MQKRNREETLARLKWEADNAAKQVPTWDGFWESVLWFNPLTRIFRLIDELYQ